MNADDQDDQNIKCVFPALLLLVWFDLRRGDTKGSCVTGDAGDHAVRKPTCDRARGKWMSKNPNCKSNDDDDEDDDDDADDETLRRGCCVKRRTRHVTRVHLGGHGTGHSEQSGDIWFRKESTPRCPWLLIT